MTRALHARGSFALAALALAAGLSLAPPAHAGMSDPHTLVLHGRVMAANGSPAANAVVTTRGGYVVSIPTDERGRFTLSIPLGSAMALKRGAFALELRATAGGKRVALSTGAPALGLEVSLLPGGTTVRVRSNLQDATTALATAFSQDGASTAWVDADFNTDPHGNASMDLRVVDDVDASGRHASSAVPVIPAPRESTPARTPAPAPSAPAPAATVAPRESTHAPATASAPAPHAPATHVVAKRAPATRPAAPVPAPRESTSAAAALPPAAAQPVAAPAASPSSATLPPAAASSSTAAPNAGAPAAPPSAAASHVAAAPHASRRASSRRHRRTHAAGALAANTSPPVPAPDSASRAARGAGAPADPLPAPPSVAANPRVKPIEPFGAPAAAAAPYDSCTCRLFGSVEIDWERPLERNFPVELTLTGPATQQGEVEMFMGSPREFHLGPLPCGDYRLIVRPRGRYRYVVARGDSVVPVHCSGVTQVRVVLVPR